LREWFANPLITYYAASFVIFSTTVMGYTPFAVWQRQELGNSSAAVFLVGMLSSVASAMAFRWVGRQIKQHGSIRIQVAMVSLRILSFIGFAVIGWAGIRGDFAVVLLVILNALSGLAWAGIAVAGNTTVAHLSPKGAEGTAVGTYTSVVSVGSILGAFVSGYLVLWLDYEMVFLCGAVGVFITVVLLLLIRRTASPEAREHL